MDIHAAIDVFLKNTEEIKVNKTRIINGGLIEDHDEGTELVAQKLHYFDVKDLEATGYNLPPDIVESIIEEVNLFQGIDDTNYEGVIQSFSKQDLKEKLNKIIIEKYDKMLDAIEIAEDSGDEDDDDSVEGFISTDYNFKLIIVFICMFVFGIWYGYNLGSKKNTGMEGAGVPAEIVSVVNAELPHPEIGV